MEELKKKIEELEKAKKACYDILKNSNVSVDFHGLSYWANRVEQLRKEIQEIL